MNAFLSSLLLTLSLNGVVQAADSPVGDPVAGQGKTAVCGACHGPDGNSLVPIFPRLAGQGERYLLKQLHDIKDGKRVVLEMTGQLNPLTDQDLADIAAYYAGQKGNVGTADPDLAAEVKRCFAAASSMRACRPASAAILQTARALQRQAFRT